MTAVDLPGEKTALRECLRLQKREEKGASFREAADRRIAEYILASTAFQKAERVLLYVGTALEVGTDELIDRALSLGKKVYLPVSGAEGIMTFHRIFSREDLVKGRFGILCPPVNAEQANNFTENDWCLVPAIAYGRDLSRLGQGGGYYDRFLKTFPGTCIGCVYDRYLMPVLPKEEHDRTVSAVITEKGVWPDAL